MATERIEIGTGILNPYTIHPAEIAMLAVTLDELSGGRFNLGLASGAEDFMNWVGLPYRYPRTYVIETIEAINKLTTNQRAPMKGKMLQWMDEAYLRFESKRRIPIYIGAMSPKTLEAIGEVADGGLPLLFPPEHYTNVMPYIQNGLERAGRSLDDVDVAACIWCSISDDQQAAEAVLADKIAYYGHAMSPLILSQLGLTQADFKDIDYAYHVENDHEKACAMVTPQMLNIGIAGTTDTLIARLEQLAEMGVRHMSFGPPLGPDVQAAIESIGRDVIPKFK
jgi:5,10-methylenetetrahydromethanopterin reductase